MKNWWNSGLFLNRSPKGVPWKPKGISSEFSPSDGFFRPEFSATAGMLVIHTTEGNTLAAAS